MAFASVLWPVARLGSLSRPKPRPGSCSAILGQFWGRSGHLPQRAQAEICGGDPNCRASPGRTAGGACPHM